MSAIPELEPSNSRNRLYVELAASEEDIHASQALRYRVFAQEQGAKLKSAAEHIDRDHFDPHCAHLLVRETGSDRVVGSTRLLTDAGAAKAGGFYSAGEFELDNLLALPGRRLEVGRTCIDPGYRQGAAIAVLWSGLAAYVNQHQIDYLFGCASIELEDGGVRARAIMNRLRQQALAPISMQVTPRLPLPEPADAADRALSAPLPPLLKAYIRLGALVCGEACLDPDFNVADVLVLVDMDKMDAAYARHFFARDGQD